LVGATTLRVRPKAGAADLAMGDQHSLAETRGDRRAGAAEWITKEQPPTAVPSTHLSVMALAL
jgi:hypothetical protein